MDITDKLFNFIKRPEKETINESPEGLCPVCWGYQQYDGKLRDVLKDKQVDVNNHRKSHMLIQNFVKEHLEGIKLKEGEIKTCPSCSCEDDQKEQK